MTLLGAGSPARIPEGTSGPFLHSGKSLRGLMLQVLLALLPVCGAAIWRYGRRAAASLALGLAVAWLADFLCDRQRAFDLSAPVTGIITALLLPATAPLWLAPAGAALAILVGKQLFGGLGRNLFNPAAVARAILMGVVPGELFAPAWPAVDATTAASPLAKEIGSAVPVTRDLLFGLHAGTLGEAAPLAVLAGGLGLLALRTIDWRIPLTHLGSIAVLALILPPGDRMLGHAPWLAGDALAHLLAGGALLTGFFMLTDPVTAPFTPRGRAIYGALAAAYTMAVRFYTPYPDGAALAVLIANAAAPLIDRYTV